MRIVLNPFGIVVREGLVYLVVTAWKYEDVRHYVLHRMSEPALLETPSVSPAEFSLAAHTRDELRFSYPPPRWSYAHSLIRMRRSISPRAGSPQTNGLRNTATG